VIVLTSEENNALTWKRHQLAIAGGNPLGARGITTKHSDAAGGLVLNEQNWVDGGNGPLPTPQEIADAVAEYRVFIAEPSEADVLAEAFSTKVSPQELAEARARLKAAKP
jgi:hypothetical protein